MHFCLILRYLLDWVGQCFTYSSSIWGISHFLKEIILLNYQRMSCTHGGGYLLFIGIFILLYSLKDALPTLIGNKYIFRTSSQMLEIVYSTLGLISFYLVVTRLSNKYPNLFKNITWLGGYSFSIYIFQEFILRIIYYKTEITVCLHPSIIPWFGFSVTLFLSVLLSITIKKL